MKNFKTKIYIADCQALNDKALFKRFYSVARNERQLKIDNIRFENDKRLSLGVELLLMKALEDLKIDYYSIEIIYDENSKPYIKGNPVYFNLSHSGNMVVCAVSASEVGVDVEEICRANFTIANRVFTENEHCHIEKSKNKNREFIRLWTLKESYMKFCGVGLGIDPRDIEIEFIDNIPGFKGLYFFEYEKNGCLISACSGENSFEKEVKNVDFKAFYQ